MVGGLFGIMWKVKSWKVNKFVVWILTISVLISVFLLSFPHPLLSLFPSQVLFQLWVAQSSEFFRRLALLLSTANSPSGPLLTEALLPHRVLSDVTQGLPHAHSACLEELKRSYEFFRYFETQHQSVPQRSSKTQPKSRELNNVHTAVRSLQLHLKALLNE